MDIKIMKEYLMNHVGQILKNQLVKKTKNIKLLTIMQNLKH